MRKDAAILVCLWWICSIWANVYSKNVFLQLKDFALQLTFAQTTTAVFIVAFLLGTKRLKGSYFSELLERISIRGLIVLSFLHAFGNLFTNISMEWTNVAFAHTIKAAEPIFTIYFSRIMGKHEPFVLYLATVPVMVGVAIASFAEMEFSYLGFISAVLSNSCFAYRNVTVKHLDADDNLAIFFLVSCGSSAILGVMQAFRSTFSSSLPADMSGVLFYLLCAAILHCSYNVFSFLVLQQVAPLTHAVINLVKRGAVIFVAIFTFSTPINSLNMFGIITTLGGGALFSWLKLQQNQNKPIKVMEDKRNKHSIDKQGLLFVVVIGLMLLVTAKQRMSMFSVHTPVNVEITNVQDQLVIQKEATHVIPQQEQQPEETYSVEIPPTNCPVSLSSEDLEALSSTAPPNWKNIPISMLEVPLIAFFGYTAMSNNYHFGQYGATYAAEREMRLRFGEDAIILPFGMLQNKPELTFPYFDRIVYNWEGTFHAKGMGTNLLMTYVNKITTKTNAPTYFINIAWYPNEEQASTISKAIQSKPNQIEHLAARDFNSYNSMQQWNLTQTLQAADLTFLLPNQFPCEVDEYFRNKNQFWVMPGKLRVLVTLSSVKHGVKEAIEQALQTMTMELYGKIEIVSILDDVQVGIRTLEHLVEGSIYEAMWLLKRADVVITGRFHCGTYARLAGVPAVLLPGNTPKVAQLAQMINSPAYPMVEQPLNGESWPELIWKKAKEAMAYAKEHPLDNDGIVDKLHTMARNNFPFKEEDSFFDNRMIGLEELKREIQFQNMVTHMRNLSMHGLAPPRWGYSYNTAQQEYVLHELVPI